MYYESEPGYFYLTIWRLTIYAKRGGAFHISFTERMRCLMIGEWFVRVIWK